MHARIQHAAVPDAPLCGALACRGRRVHRADLGVGPGHGIAERRARRLVYAQSSRSQSLDFVCCFFVKSVCSSVFGFSHMCSDFVVPPKPFFYVFGQ